MFSILRIDSYVVVVAMFFASLSLGAVYFTNQIFANYFPQTSTISSTEAVLGQSSELFFLRSKQTVNRLQGFGLEAIDYEDRLEEVAKRFRSSGYETSYIDENDINKLEPGQTLLALDTISIDNKAIADLKHFISEGGNIIFNYHFAYHDKARYRGNEIIEDITGLYHASWTTHIKMQDNSVYLTPALLSPIGRKVYPGGSQISAELYDPLPVLVSEDGIKPDAIMTHWQVNTALELLDDQQQVKTLLAEESGVLWHGRYGKGSWIYTSLPSYSLFSDYGTEGKLDALMLGLVEFANNPLTVMTYPYLDSDNAVFVSEDTEFRFEQFDSFINLANEYEVPVTAFMVSSLAEEHPELVAKAAASPFIELGSHSFTHQVIAGTGRTNIVREVLESKRIIEQLADIPKVYGFRPPREEFDDVMNDVILEAGYAYVFEKRKSYLYPTIESDNDLFVIPRSGTDDYQYLVQLNWTAEQILARMIEETELLTAVNGIYAFSMHTQLMAYKDNIRILQQYFEYLSSRPDLLALSGQDIINRISQVRNISYEVSTTQNNLIIKLINNDAITVEKVTFRVHWPSGKKLDTLSSELLGLSFDYQHFPLQGYTDITILDVRPKSDITLIAKHADMDGVY